MGMENPCTSKQLVEQKRFETGAAMQSHLIAGIAMVSRLTAAGLSSLVRCLRGRQRSHHFHASPEMAVVDFVLSEAGVRE